MNFLIRPEVSKPAVAVEIGSDWLKIAESRLIAGNYTVTNTKFIKLAEIEEPLSASLARVFKELKIGTANVTVCLPRHLVTVRILELPSLDGREIRDMVNMQIGKQTPYSKEEVIFDHRIVESKREGYTAVMLAISRHTIVKERVEALQIPGVTVDRVTFSTVGVCGWFANAYPLATQSDLDSSFIIDIDSNYSDFIVMRGSRICFTRSVSIGANHLTEDAGKWTEKLLLEAKHCEELYFNEAHGAKITKAYLAGATGVDKDLITVLGATLGVKVESADLLKNIRIKDGRALLKDESLKGVSMTALLGISLNLRKLEFDLTPPELKVQRSTEEKRKSLMTTGILAALILMMVPMLILTHVSYNSLYLNRLKEKIAQIEKSTGPVERLHNRMGLIERRLDTHGSILSQLNEVYRLVPTEIYLNNLEIVDRQGATLKGVANLMSDVFKFVSTLEKSSMFANVKTKYTTARKDKGAEYTEFEITCSYEKEKL